MKASTLIILQTILGILCAPLVSAKLLPIAPSLQPKGYDGATYYVSLEGSDGNDGLTIEQPFRTLQTAADSVQPGDTVLVREGVYSDLNSEGRVVTITAQGTPDKWIRFANYPEETPTIKINGFGGIRVKGGAYIEIDGFVVEGKSDMVDEAAAIEFAKNFQNDDYTNPLLFSTGIAVEYGGKSYPHHAVIRNNTVSKCSGNGIAIKRADYILVEGNRVFENAHYSPWGTSGISVWSSWNYNDDDGVYRTVIRNNIAYRNENRVIFWLQKRITDGNGIIIDALINSQDNLVGDGYTKPYSGSILLENNICYKNGGRGINLYESENIDVVNNTLYKNATHPEIDGEICLGNVTNCRLYNNVLFEAKGQKSITEWRNLEGNGIYTANNNITRFGGTYADIPLGDQGVEGSPEFIDVTSYDFRLKPESPAINTGNATLFSLVDINEAQRPAGDRPDMGAYEN